MSEEEQGLPSIEVDDLHKSYGPKEVVKGISFKVDPGEIFGFIGKNGVGKSTTIDCMVGLKRFEKGTIKICGVDIAQKPLEAKTNFGYVPSEPLTYESMTGNEYLQFIASAFKMKDEEFTANVEKLKKTFDIYDKDLNRRIEEYSHGMKQKVCLMASLVHNPKVWIMDEPTVGLDVSVYEALKKTIVSFAKNGGAVFLTSHNLNLVEEICNRVDIVKDGEIAASLDFEKNPSDRQMLRKTFFEAYGEQAE